MIGATESVFSPASFSVRVVHKFLKGIRFDIFGDRRRIALLASCRRKRHQMYLHTPIHEYVSVVTPVAL